MPPIAKLIASVLLFASFFTATVNLSAANNSTLNSNKIPSSQALESKKVLKKKLSLDYTNPKFESDLDKDQKDAILTSLKKWKGQLPVDNAFTVTSIASLKTDTTDTKSKVKKNKKETPNAQVVYMWARSVNPNWPIGRIPTGEESEEGDPRFICTPFNVLLKQTKNGKYKASIERDKEVKTESQEVTESSQDDQIYQDLFGINLNDNALTAFENILLEPGEINSSANSSNISSVLSNLTSLSSTQISNTQSTISSNLNLDFSSMSSIYSSSSISSKTVGFLEGLLNFGKVKASAGENDYSWPWKNGEKWYAAQSWHECQPYYGGGIYFNDLTTTGCALDLVPYNGASTNIVSPISGTVKRACGDQIQSSLQIGQMSILHLDTNSNITNNATGVSLKKSTLIGNAFTLPSKPYDKYFNGYRYYWSQDTVTGVWFFNSPCGSTSGLHIHLRMEPILETFPKSKIYTGSMLVDGQNIQGAVSYKNGSSSDLFTSQNTLPNPITDPNIQSVQPAQVNYMKVMDEGCLTADNSRVYMYDRVNNDCQKMRYNSGNNTITNPYGKCLDGGDIYNNASNRWIRYSTCNNSNNQKWKQDDGGRIWSLQKNSSNNAMCIEYYDTNNSSGLDVNPCNYNQGQKWYFDIGITREAAPSGSNITDPNITSVQPPQANWAWAIDDRCGTAENTQVVMKARDNGNCQKMRYNSGNYTITNPYGKCLDAGDVNNFGNKWVRFSTCNGANNQKWKQDNGGRIWTLAKNNSSQTMCIEYESLTDQYGINANVCNGNQNQKWYFDMGVNREEVPITPAPVPTSNYKVIKSYTNSGYGFNLYGGGDGNQTPVKLWKLTGSNNELFSFEATGEIKNKISNKCIDAGNINDANNRWLRIEACHGGTNQKFYQDGSNRIHSYANTNLCVDSAVLNSQGSTIYMYPCTNGDNQKWQLN
jgi:Ricin-type beta-trefoil lectin domain